MKKLFYLFLVLFIFTGCSLINSPKMAVNNFIKTMEKEDYEAMAKYATPEVVVVAKTFGPLLKTFATSNGKVKEVTETINNDSAVVTVLFDNDRSFDFDLEKINGNWKVSMNIRTWLNNL